MKNINSNWSKISIYVSITVLALNFICILLAIYTSIHLGSFLFLILLSILQLFVGTWLIWSKIKILFGWTVFLSGFINLFGWLIFLYINKEAFV